MPPARPAVAVGAGHVRDGPPLHHRLGDPALLGAVPDRGVAGAALVVGVEPAGHLAHPLEVLDRPDAAPQVAAVDRIGLLLPCDGVPLPPDLQHPVHGDVVVPAVQFVSGVGLPGRYAAHLVPVDLLAALAVADAERAGAGPAVREEAVHRVALVDLA